MALDRHRRRCRTRATPSALEVRGREHGGPWWRRCRSSAAGTGVPAAGGRRAGTFPHTDAEIERDARLPRTRRSLDELFAVVPEALRLAGGLDLAEGMPEPDVVAHMEDLGGANRARGDRPGVLRRAPAPTTTRSPRSTGPWPARSEFVTSYTPYQPEVAQGVLQAVFEFQTMVARLTRAWRSPTPRSTTGPSALGRGGQPGRRGHGAPGGVGLGRGPPHWREVLATFAAGTGHRVETCRWSTA